MMTEAFQCLASKLYTLQTADEHTLSRMSSTPLRHMHVNMLVARTPDADRYVDGEYAALSEQ